VRFRDDSSADGRTRPFLVSKIAKRLGYSCHSINKSVAHQIAEKAIEKGIGCPNNDNPMFNDFIMNFWDWNNSDYIRIKNREAPNSICRKYANNLLCAFNKHAKDFFVGKRLQDIKVKQLEDLKIRLMDQGLSNNVINLVIKAIRKPLKYAYKLQMIPNDPTLTLQKLKEESADRDVLTIAEAKGLLSHLRSLSEGNPLGRLDYLIIRTAMETGMRKGEIRALRREDIFFPLEANKQDNIIVLVVKHSLSREDGLKCTKSKKDRKVIMTIDTAKELIAYEEFNPTPSDDHYIFWSTKNPGQSIGETYIDDHFNNALIAIGITEEQRIQRNITFHSLRHFFCNFVQKVLTAEQVQKLLGHASITMTEHYTHNSEEIARESGNQIAGLLKELDRVC